MATQAEKPLKLLVAEDDAATRLILCRKAQEWGFDPIEASEGKKALELLTKADGPRLALLDWILPGIDGVQICQELDRRRQVPRVYRIVLTIKTSVEDMIRALDSGADDCLGKPVTPGILRSRLNVGRRFVEMEDQLYRKTREFETLAQEMAGQYVFQKSLLDAIPHPVYVKDRAGKFLAANDALAQLLGTPETELIGRSLEDAAPKVLPNVYYAGDEELHRNGGVQNYEAQVDGADGSRRHMLFHKAIFWSPEGGPGGIIGSMLDITDRKVLERELERLATTDALTGAHNRRYFIEVAEKELARVRRYGGDASILMMDIDHFKRINDTHGHAVGDEALKLLSRLCVSALREGDLFGRLGGEEFAIMLPETSLQHGVEAAERLRRMIEAAKFQSGKIEIPMTVSVGVSAMRREDATFDAVLERADKALYRAKNGSRNRVEVGE